MPNCEVHAPPEWGGRRPNAGRPPANLRTLDISDVGIEFNEPVTYTADITLEKCGSCGRLGWEEYSVAVTAATPRNEPDEDGNYYPVLATVNMPEHLLRHTKNCKQGVEK